MEGSSLVKIQKVSVVFTKWFVVLALILIAAGAGYYLYKNSGYKEYQAALGHLSSLTGSDKTDMGDKFFGVWDTPNSYSGILASSWPYGIWVWEKSGLKYQPLDQSTRFLAIYGCSKEKIVNIAISVTAASKARHVSRKPKEAISSNIRRFSGVNSFMGSRKQ
jgi:hypothetical protein